MEHSMYVSHYHDTPEQTVTDPGAEEATIRWLISSPEGAPNFAMRLIELGSEGQSPYHTHGFEHEIYVLSGVGEVVGADGRWPLHQGSVVFVRPGEEHNFRNRGDEPFRFICCIPLTS